MKFTFYPLMLDFIAGESIQFPEGKAANILRGALGTILNDEVFAPIANDPGPSGFANPPRPYVFRARHLDGRIIQSGEQFHVGMNVFSKDAALPVRITEAFATIAAEGLGPNRRKAELQHKAEPPQPVSLNLTTEPTPTQNIQIQFLTPTELKHESEIAHRPEFPILFARIRDRVSTLRALYAEGPLEIDFRAIGERSTAIKLTNFEGHIVNTKRRSTRTGQVHSIGGFTGTAEYEGDLAEFLPWLEAARWTGVGRQCSWGKGEIAVTARRPQSG